MREQYEALGLEVIPLQHNTKKPVAERWPTLDPVEQWAMQFWNTPNIGLRLGSSLAVLDADSQAAVLGISGFMRGFGLHDRPTVRTPSECGHFYLTVSGMPEKFTRRQLLEYPESHLLANKSLSVVPDSVVGGKSYVFESDLKQVLNQPSIRWEDLLKLVGEGLIKKWNTNWSEAPIPFFYSGKILADKYELASRIEQALPGQRIGKYASRSEAVEAILTEMVFKGWSFDRMAGWFPRHTPAYWDHRGARWFRGSAGAVCTDLIPKELLEAYDYAGGLTKPAFIATYRAFVTQAAKWTGKYPFDPKAGYALLDTTYEQIGSLTKSLPMTEWKRVNRVLVPGRYLELVSKGTRGIASVWKVMIPHIDSR